MAFFAEKKIHSYFSALYLLEQVTKTLNEASARTVVGVLMCLVGGID